MRKLVPFLLLGAFLALLIPRMLQSMAQSGAYPEWSTHRSDPLGAKVLYLALARAPGLSVSLGAPPRFGKEKEQTGLESGRELVRRLRDIPAALGGDRRALRAEWEEMRRHA